MASPATARTVIIDCDPGQDDAINLLLALASPADLDVIAITTVAGNVPLQLTQRNARLMCDLAGRDDVPVFAGHERPLERDLVTAENIHGSTGIDGVDGIDGVEGVEGVEGLQPRTPLQEQHAVDYIIETLKVAAPDSITLVPTGPLTNIAAAISRAPCILPAVREIVLMGGALREGGNTTPSAEFNVFVDPHAAQAVFRCGRPIVAMGLDVTHQVLANRERIARIRAIGNAPAIATAGMLEYFSRHDSTKYGEDGAPLHDPCTIAWLLRPELFETRLCNIEIEVESALTQGHTAVDFWGVSGRVENAQWAHGVDAEGFYDLLCQRLAVYPTGGA